MSSAQPNLRRRSSGTDPDTLPADWHPVLRRVYAARGINDRDDLDTSLVALHDPALLSGMARATRILADAVTTGQRLLLVGDFDADGATSCAVALRLLRDMGAAWVDYLVPNRFDYGYGLTPEIVDVARESSPDILITVDNGISSHMGVAAARRAGIRVVVTDHHLPGAELPSADAIVNPNLPGDEFPSKALAGVGVIFYLLTSVRALLRERGWFEARGLAVPNLATVLDLVALGTVADVVPLDRNNRILVEQGLRRIRGGRACAGVRALLDVAGRRGEGAVAADLGFSLGPRLNAAGRLEDMSVGIECLLTDDPGCARVLAQTLDELNRQRREIEGQMKAEAMVHVATLFERFSDDAQPLALCLMEHDWHQGVIGIVASRVKEYFHRPVIAFAPVGDGMLKGSARSIPGLHIRDLIERVDTTHPGLIERFGGHAMAAGLSLTATHFEKFREVFEQTLKLQLSDDDLDPSLLTDGELHATEMTMATAQALRMGGPWGQGFPEPMFEGVFEVLAQRVVGGTHLKLRLRANDPGAQPVDGIAFSGLERGWEALEGWVKVAYRLDINEFRGDRRLQLIIRHMERV